MNNSQPLTYVIILTSIYFVTQFGDTLVYGKQTIHIFTFYNVLIVLEYFKEMDLYLNPEKPILANVLAELHKSSRKKSFDEYNRKAWYGKEETERLRLDV